MYAIKPCSNVGLIGATIESYALGIGMLWRETNCIVVEKQPHPSYERHLHRRCLIPKGGLKLLSDLGCSSTKIASILKPARGWRILTNRSEVIRTSACFPGSPEGEQCFHCSYGSLLRILRSEFLKYGGSVEWGTTCSGIIHSSDGLYTMERTYGCPSSLETIIDTTATQGIFTGKGEHPTKLVRITTGVTKLTEALGAAVFGAACDVSILVGESLVAHCWVDNGNIYWKAVSEKNEELIPEKLDGLLSNLLTIAESKTSWSMVFPNVSLTYHPSGKSCVVGDGLFPVDPFEFRGDNAMCMVKEASLLCREIYGKKYRRGDMTHILSHFANESLEKRKALFCRDEHDLQEFLHCNNPRLEQELKSKYKWIE